MKKVLLIAIVAMMSVVTSCALTEGQNLGNEAKLSVSGTPVIEADMYIRGTFSDWNSVPMVNVSNDVYSATVEFSAASAGKFKFDTYADWSVNYGDNEADGVAELSGADISVPAGTKATVTFNADTKEYSLDTTPWVTSVTCRPGLDNMLFYMYNPYYYVVPVKVYKNGVLIDEDLIHPTSKDGVQAHFNLDIYTVYQFVINYTNEQLKTVLSLDTNVMIDSLSQTLVMDIEVVTNDGFLKTYDSVSVRSTTSSWNPTAMELVGDHTWQVKLGFNGNGTDRFKFDIYNDWSLNFGDNETDGIADQDGEDIYVGTTEGEYTITFNDQTKAYTVVAPQPFNGSVSIDLENFWTTQFYLAYNTITFYKEAVEYTNVPAVPSGVGNTYNVTVTGLPAGSYSAVYDGRDRFSKTYPDTLEDHAFYAETSFVISETQPEALQTIVVEEVQPRLDMVLYHTSSHPYPGWHDAAIVDLQAVLYSAGVPQGAYTIKKYFYDEGMYSSWSARVKIWDLDAGVYSFEVDTFANGTNYKGGLDQIMVAEENVYHSLVISATNSTQFDSVYPSMFLRSDTTDWNGVAMTLVDDHVWKGLATFTNGNGTQVKFDVYNDWTVNFGDTLIKDYIADQNGGNIGLRYPTGTFEFFFNDETKAYSYSHK